MKKILQFTATLEYEWEDEYSECPITFNEFENCDYDNIGRPLYHLEEAGWKISKKKVK